MRVTHLNKTWLLGSVALSALALGAGSAAAGGLEVREQSAFFQGTSFAGSAAGGSSLSSIYWNPAASSFVGSGVTTDSSYSLILLNTDLTADAPGFGGDLTTDIGRDAVVPASYLAWRYNDRTVFAVSMNSPFGLTTKPDSLNWTGNPIGTTAKVFSLNVTPTVSYQITPQISVGVGAQFQFVELKKFKTRGTPVLGNTNLEGEDLKVGGVAGINITPFRGTSVGLGYRSRIDYDVEGTFTSTLAGPSPAELGITTPDKVTLSLRQELTPSLRLLGTVEWTNWSLLDQSPVNVAALPAGTVVLDFGWEDGWFYSLGGEYDVNEKLTVRGGVAYEESPIQDPGARLLQVPDNDRIWASVGATYNWSDSMQINAAYSHVFVEDGRFDRNGLTGEAEASADIISVGLTMKLGGTEAPLK
jgi:long-chain fatty acid transport protein